MEYIYSAYTKLLHGKTYFYVKKFIRFPEFNNVPDVLAGYGMHTEFDTACRIAMIPDASIKLKLLQDLADQPERSKVIDISFGRIKPISNVR